MTNIDANDGNHRKDEPKSSTMASRDTGSEYVNPRPQRLNTWFNLIPVKKVEDTKPREIVFLDSFVTIEPKTDGTDGKSYTVRFEGQREMCVVVKYGVIFVWYGEDLSRPDRPFPTIFEKPYNARYISSKVSTFEKTHVMDFVENGSDNLHFKVVHLWEASRLYDHKISEETITLQQDVKINYGASTTNLAGRLISKVLPQLNLHHDFVYHGPGLATVAAQGLWNVNFHSLVSLTPEGPHNTRLYVTIGLDPSTLPRWAERIFGWFSPGRTLCEVLAGIMANFVENEFHMDAVIFANKRYQDLNLLPSEEHLYEVRRWGETFYPKDFEAPVAETKPPEGMRWVRLDEVGNISNDKVQSYSVCGEELIAFKDSQGVIRVYDAYCPHQGAHLGYGGTLEDDCIHCPFHGFSFGVEGKFTEELCLNPIQQRIEGGAVEVFV